MAKKKEETEKNEEILQRLELLFGKGTVVSASSIKHLNVKEWTSTGSLSLDLATKGGIPKGGLCTCILGKESSSKTLMECFNSSVVIGRKVNEFFPFVSATKFSLLEGLKNKISFSLKIDPFKILFLFCRRMERWWIILFLSKLVFVLLIVASAGATEIRMSAAKKFFIWTFFWEKTGGEDFNNY